MEIEKVDQVRGRGRSMAPRTRAQLRPAARSGASPSPSPSSSCRPTLPEAAGNAPPPPPPPCVVRVRPPPALFAAVPTYRIDLATAPEHRWDEVGADFAPTLDAAVASIEPFFRSMLGDRVVGFLLWLCGVLCWLGLMPHAAEVRGLSRCTGVSMGRLAAVQLVYEATSACTSVVVQSSSAGVPVHVRTMDWNMPFDLRPLTISVEFFQNGRPLFVATTWAGFVGIYTGMRTHAGSEQAFSISINYRLTGDSVLRNLCMVLLLAPAVGTFVRHVLTHATTFEEARARIDKTWLLAPCYIILAGGAHDEACLFTRNRCGHERLRTLGDGSIVQCNTDHWDCDPLIDVLESAERRDAAAEMLEQLSKARVPGGSSGRDGEAVALHALWRFLHTAPIRNEITVYATVMIPARAMYGSGTRIGAHDPEIVSGF
jgi:acid ceramidase